MPCDRPKAAPTEGQTANHSPGLKLIWASPDKPKHIRHSILGIVIVHSDRGGLVHFSYA